MRKNDNTRTTRLCDDSIPTTLKSLARWVVWKYEIRDGNPKPTKVPYEAKTGDKASVTDPSTWTTFKEAVVVCDRYDGIGFVLTDEDDIVGVDLDHCRDSVTAIIEPWALAIIDQLYSYTEISPSGTGIRIFVHGVLPPRGRKRGPLEFYETKRYLTVTGNHLPNTPLTIEARHETLQRVHAIHFPPPSSNGNGNGDGHRKSTPITANDETQLARMFGSKNGATIKALNDGDWSGCGYPSQSEGDAAFCCHLAFWLGRDQERMDRIFRLSGLMRPKWDAPRGNSTYGAGVIAAACELVTDTYQEPSEAEAEVLRLASLSLLEYDKVRKDAAKRLGITLSTLDQVVREARSRKGQAAENAPASDTIPPAGDPVDGVVLADALTTMIRRFVVIEPAAIHATVLWVLWAYAFNAWSIAPILALISPEKRCGKTSLLAVLARLLDRSLLSSNISAAAIFRAIDAFHPVLLVDEIDSFTEDDEPLRGILNSGHTKDAARVIRVVGDGAQMTIKTFSTWCPKVLASIGALSDTLEDRSVTIPMKRRKKGESKEPLRWSGAKGAALKEELKLLAGQCKRWVQDHTEELTVVSPLVPDTLNDRAADNWYVLLCVAETLGGEWTEKGRLAAVKLSGGELETDSIRVQLLHDIRTIIIKGTTKGTTKFGSVNLCTDLINILESPWGTWKRGQGITPSQLARQLKPFGVSSRNLKLPDGSVLKGYDADDFVEAFERYLPPLSQEPEVERF